jgi:hypothetical protein
MSVRLKALVAVPIVALAIWAWFGLRDRGSPAAQAVEGMRTPVPLAMEPAASSAALPTAEGLACIPSPASRRAARRASAEQQQQEDLTQAAELATTRGRLGISADPEHLAAAALLATAPGERAALITQALATSGNNPVVLWIAVRICSRGPGREACPVDDLSDRLLAIEPQNSESWMLAAVRRLGRGDDAGALYAVQRAGAAAESHTYWAEMIELLERAYAASTDYPFTKRVASAIGIAAANLPSYGDYSKMCATRSRASPVWAHACLAYGERAEQRGDTAMGESIGRSMQVVALKELDDPTRLAAVTERREQADAARLEAGKDSPLVISTPGLLAGYLDVLAQQGETAALRWSRTEAAQLRAKLPPCAAQLPDHGSASLP